MNIKNRIITIRKNTCFLAIVLMVILMGCNLESIVNIPVASFDYSPKENIKINDTIIFLNNSENSNLYFWDFGDGTTSTIKDPTHVYESYGFFNVTLISMNEYFSDTISKTITLSDIISLNETRVIVNPYPTSKSTSIDVDFDGVTDFTFNAQYFSSPISGSFTYSSAIHALNTYEVFYDSLYITYYHRDVTPSTTTIEKEYIPKICIFGDTIQNTVNAKTGVTFFTSYQSYPFGNHDMGIWNKDEIRYIGFRKTVDGKSKIGWIKLKVQDYCSITLYSFKVPKECENLIIDK